MMLSYEYGGDKNEIKLIISILCRKYYEEKSKDDNKLNNRSLFHKLSFKDIMIGESHFNEIKKQNKKFEALKYISNFILSLIPNCILNYLIFTDLKIEVEELMKLILLIKYNSFPIINSYGKEFGLGYYPAGAFINHSCSPNIIYSYCHHCRTIAFLAMCDIKKGEEINYSYIDLLLNREYRQKLLYNAYLFYCKCKRCITPIEKSTDRFLNGYVCVNKINDRELCRGEMIIKNEKEIECVKCHCIDSLDDRKKYNINNNNIYN